MCHMYDTLKSCFRTDGTKKQLGLQRNLSQAELSVVQSGLHSLLFWLSSLGLLAQARLVWEILNRWWYQC